MFDVEAGWVTLVLGSSGSSGCALQANGDLLAAALLTVVFSHLVVRERRASHQLAAARERNRTAREIHHSLGHHFTSANVQLEAARAMVADRSAASATLQIIGVAKDGKYASIAEGPTPHAFLPVIPAQFREFGNSSRAVIAGATSEHERSRLMDAMRRELSRIDARVAIQSPLVGRRHLDNALYLPRVAATVRMILGTIALCLAAIGIYSVTAYGVSQRTKEIGIRVALGARTADILRLALGQGLLLVVIGLGAEAIGSVVLNSAFAEFAVGVSSADPTSFAVTFGVLLVAATIGTLLPSLHATRINPMIALRNE